MQAVRFLMLAIPLALAGCNNQPKSNAIPIGHVEPNASETECRALSLVLETLPSEQRPLEREIQIRHAAGSAKPEEAAAQAVRLIALNRNHIVIAGDKARTAEQVALAAQGDPALLLGTAGWSGENPKSNYFTLGLSPAEQGRSLALFQEPFLHRPSAKALICRAGSSRFQDVAADAYRREAQRLGAEVVDIRLDEKRTLTRLLETGKGSTTLLLAGPPVEVAAVWETLSKVMTFEQTAFVGEEGEMAELRSTRPLPEGLSYATAYFPGQGEERLTNFAKAYESKHGTPADAQAIVVADALEVALEAIRRAKSLDPVKLREELTKADASFDTLSGSLRFNATHHALRPIYIAKLTNGTPQFAKQLDPK